MKPAARTFWTVVILAGTLVAADAPTRPAGGSTSAPSGKRSLLEDAPFDESGVPVTPPATAKPRPRKEALPLLREGTPLVERVTGIAKDPTGKWWTIEHARVGRLYLLPCGLLEAVEGRLASPETQFRLTGEIHRYRGAYYLMLRKADLITARPRAAPTTQPAASRPARRKPASPEDIARELMREEPGRPILPLAPPHAAKITVASVAPPGKPLRPGRMVVNRLTRLVAPGRDGWSVLAFEADNTLREPPMRILPSRQLEKMEKRSGGPATPGARFHVSGEVHSYRGRNYVLLRCVRRKREMGQF